MRSGVLKGARKIELEKRDNLIGRPGYILIDVLKETIELNKNVVLVMIGSGPLFIMGPLSRPRSKILRVAVSRIILSSEASKVKLVGNLVA